MTQECKTKYYSHIKNMWEIMHLGMALGHPDAMN